MRWRSGRWHNRSRAGTMSAAGWLPRYVHRTMIPGSLALIFIATVGLISAKFALSRPADTGEPHSAERARRSTYLKNARAMLHMSQTMLVLGLLGLAVGLVAAW